MAQAVTRHASETGKHFSDATCEELIALVTRSGSFASGREPPADWLAALQALYRADELFAAWCNVVSGGNGAQTSSEEICRAIAQRLPEWLLNAPSLKNDTSQSCQVLSQSDSRGRQLLDICNLVVRLKSLESSFALELQRRKTEAIYHFAYGLSHELNNPLANIATRAGILARDETQRGRLQLLESIIDNAMRGCEMLGDLMLVARPPQLSLESLSVEQFARPLIDKADPWARARDVEILVKLDSTRTLYIDVSAMREVVWSLIRNAIEAMPDGGQIFFSVSDADADRVRMEIADEGCGLSKQALEYCFDPYFSGREAGRGLGVGLTKARRIVELHAGELNLFNRPTRGCIAEIFLKALQ